MDSAPWTGSTVLYGTNVPTSDTARECLSTLRSAFDGATVVPVADVDACRDELADGDVAAVVTEVDLAGETGAELVAAVRRVDPDLPVVLYAERPRPEAVADAYAAGATAVVRRDAGERVLVETLRNAASVDAGGESTDRPSESWFEAIVEAANDAVVVVDGDSVVRFANPAVENVFGYAAAALEGESLTTLMSDAAAERHLVGIERYLETGDRSLDWSGVELVGRHRDGHDVPLWVSFAEIEQAGERLFVGVVRDVSERKRLEGELERILERVTDAFFGLDEDWKFTYANERAAELLRTPRSELVGRRVWEAFPEAVGTTFQEEYERAMTRAESVWFEEYYPPLDTWFEVNAYPSESGLSVYFRDVSERKRIERRREERARRLEALNERARRLSEAETRTAVCSTTVEAAAEVLDLSYSLAALYDDASGELNVAARTDEAGELVDASLLDDVSTSPVWESFIRDDQRVVDLEPDEGDGPSVRTLATFPLGDHGVFVTVSPDPDAFAETDLLVAELLCANARSALDRAARESDLRQQRDQLEAQNDRLERVNRINRAIREITQVLIRADSHEEIEQLVCEKLAAIDPFRFVWIGEHEGTSGEVTPVATGGEGDGYLEEITVTADNSETGRGPAGRAVQSGRPQVQNSILQDAAFEPWREAALSRGFRSNVSVPISYRETLYGVLNVYSGRPMTFEEMEVAVLEELGLIIGYAMSAVERRKALVSGSSVELTFAVQELDAPLFGFIDGTEGEFELENAVRRLDGRMHLFFTARGVTFERIEAHAETSPDVERLTLISSDEDGCLFECTVRDSTFVSTVLDRGAVLDAVSVEDGVAEVTLCVPGSADVRGFVGYMRETFGRAELVARREFDDPVMTRGEFESEVRNRLTERQEEVIKTAYFAGFFDWPRKSNGQEVAELLGVTQPTVNRHVRAGERTVFGLLFDD